MTEQSDEQLMQLLKGGNDLAMKELLERYQNQLLNFFYRMCGDRHWAEDLVQMTFSRVYLYRSSYKQELHFAGWLYQVARNTWATEYKKNGKLVYLSIDDKTDRLAEVSMEAGGNTTKEIIKTALSKLSDQNRQLVVFYHLQGFCYAELSVIFNVSEQALRVRLCRALKELGKVLKSMNYEHK